MTQFFAEIQVAGESKRFEISVDGILTKDEIMVEVEKEIDIIRNKVSYAAACKKYKQKQLEKV